MEREEKISSTYSVDLIEQIVSNVIGFSQAGGNLLNKYNDTFFLNYFDRLKIDQTIKKLESHQKQLELHEFVRLFLGSITHAPDQTLYLTMSLINLHKKVMEETSNETGVKFADFTAFLCSKISEGDPDLVIPMKEIAPDRMVPDVNRVRDIDINPPPILSKVDMERPKITKDKNKKDKKLDEKKPLAQFIFSRSLDSIITLGRLSSSVSLYHPDTLNLQNKIIPNACKLMAKDVAILSMAYCERQNRIGCIINNIGMTFWEASDNFVTQKILGMNKPDYDPKICGDKIYYLKLFQEWVTTDHDTILYWDLKEQVITKSIKRSNTSTINDICEINHLRALLVSYNSNSVPEEKILILYQDNKQVSKLSLGNPGCHSLCYNPSTQLVVSLGYQSIVTIYHIDVKTYDINCVAELKAHTSILTCVCNIPDTSMVISGDDIGYVKLWDLNYMRCLQSIKIAKNLQQIECNGDHLMYADSRLNMIPMDSKTFLKPTAIQKCQQIYGVYQFFREEEESLWVITRKDAREIRLSDGRTKNILVVCSSEEEVSAAAELFNGFLIGTSKGDLFKYALNGERKWKISAHEGEIRAIKVDFENHLICTAGSDNHLIVWSQKTILDQENVRKRINFNQKDINMVELCPFANLLLVSSSSDNSLTIWNYDSIKLAYIIDFEAPICAAKIFPDKEIIMVSTTDGKVSVFKYVRKQAKFRIQLCFVIEIQSMGLMETQKQITQPDSSLLYISDLTQCEDSNLIFGSTPKGVVYCFQPQGFYPNPNYKREYEPMPSIKRPTRETYDHQILKNQFIRCSSDALLDEGNENLELIWVNKVHKDVIIFQSLLSLQKKYICTQCTDGYFRITELSNGTVVCSRKITYPLPVHWDIETENYGDLKNQIHQAISVIDSILKSYAYQLTLKEQKSLNLTEFMEKMISSRYKLTKQIEKAPIMSNQYTAADIKGICPKSPTLKALEAYKRLQLIKKQNQHDISEMSFNQNVHYETTALEKQSIRNYLEPNYLPKLLNKGLSEANDFKGGQHMKKLEHMLNGNKKSKKQIQKDKEKQQRQNKSYLTLMHKSFGKSLDESLSKYEKNTMGSLKRSKMQDMTVKKILTDINNKLKHYKKERSSFLSFT